MKHNYIHNACVGCNGGYPDHRRMGTGYYEAAILLCNHVITEKVGMDTLIYPVLELYRHGFELMSKSVGIDLQQVIQGQKFVTENHNLNELWKTMMPLIEKHIGIMPAQLKASIKVSLKSFNALNHNAQLFRYPTDKKGNKSMENKRLLNYIDLKPEIETSYEVMDQLSDYFHDLTQNEGDHGI